MLDAKRREKPKKEENPEVKEVTPQDLKKTGVQESGLAMDAGKALQNHKKEMEKAIKELGI